MDGLGNGKYERCDVGYEWVADMVVGWGNWHIFLIGGVGTKEGGKIRNYGEIILYSLSTRWKPTRLVFTYKFGKYPTCIPETVKYGISNFTDIGGFPSLSSIKISRSKTIK